MPSRALLDKADVAYGLGIDRRDWAPLQRLYHAEALIETPIHPGAVIRPDAFFRDESALHRTFIAGPRELVPIDEHAGMVVGRLRFRDENRFRTVDRVWLLTFAEALIFRQRSLMSPGEARAVYQRHGLDLGMREPTS